MDNRHVDNDNWVAPMAESVRESLLILPRWMARGIPVVGCDGNGGSATSVNRRGVLKLGLALGLAGLTAASASRPAAAGSANWRYCNKCRGLFWAEGGRGVCPKGGRHTVGSDEYSLDSAVPGATYRQSNWRYCHKCHGLFSATYGRGVCPKGGTHHVGNVNYQLEYHDAGNPPQGFEQAGWFNCRKCYGLFWSIGGSGVCPKGNGHNGGASRNYSVDYVL